MSSNWRIAISVLIGTVLLLSGQTGSTQASNKVTELVTKAGEARADLRYEEAIELLMKAYELYPDPRLLFNAAKVYYDSSDCQNALRYFVRTSEMSADKPEEFTKLRAAVEKELRQFACPDEKATFGALLMSYSESPHPIVAQNIAMYYEQMGECTKAKGMYQRAADDPQASPTVREEVTEALGRLDCPEGDVGGEETDTSTMTYVAYGLGALGVVSLVATVLVDQSTLSDIDEFDSRTKPAFLVACDGQSPISDPQCKAAYERAASLEDEINSGRLTTLLTLSAGCVLIGSGAVLWYLDNQTDVFEESGISVRLAPTLGTESVGATLHLEF